MELSLDLGDCMSLKEKRSVIRPIIERLRRMGVSCAEVADQDLWNRARIGVAFVSGSSGIVEDELRACVEVCLDLCPGPVEVVSEDRIHPPK